MGELLEMFSFIAKDDYKPIKKKQNGNIFAPSVSIPLTIFINNYKANTFLFMFTTDMEID